ncbi:MAG: hypothetical protein IPK07_11145 [Deltaproteobacteria bacterium]|nr:hypothetical protein [Deltaproteobacteria bacterium]
MPGGCEPEALVEERGYDSCDRPESGAEQQQRTERQPSACADLPIALDERETDPRQGRGFRMGWSVVHGAA